ncbi:MULTISPECIES: hypothetical protein [Halocynthiibacter]|uniref:Porin n=1 Tax=Halocynthiibacter halioticoli TaxID=2986804 RepID=A0AAE3J0D2_9RHOB|nr:MULTISPECIES: hypothetical protein [Halocynthiibacter]MCV6824405.1 hypothetical protein [Halocynthiibacter halioticoli]MCW4057406.1 hypothetical protein [Halocynthiibacter sp. SDUM655004]
MAKRSLFCAFVASVAATQVAAEVSAPNGIYIRGDVGLERFSVFGDSETTFSGRLDFGISPDQHSSNLGPFGLHFAIEGLDGPGGDDPKAFYAAVSYTGDFGRFSIGAPRPVTDEGYFDTHLFLGSTWLDFELGQLTRSWVSNAYLFSNSDDRPIGARWDGQFSNTKVGISYNQMDDLDLRDWNLAVRHDFPVSDQGYQFAVYGGLEWTTLQDYDQFLYRIGIEAHSTEFNAGLRWDRLESPFENTITAYADYNIVRNASVGVDLMYSDGFSGELVYGLNGKYRFFNDGWLNVFIGSNVHNTDYFYGAGLGQHF